MIAKKVSEALQQHEPQDEESDELKKIKKVFIIYLDFVLTLK